VAAVARAMSRTMAAEPAGARGACAAGVEWFIGYRRALAPPSRRPPRLGLTHTTLFKRGLGPFVPLRSEFLSYFFHFRSFQNLANKPTTTNRHGSRWLRWFATSISRYPYMVSIV
jgi:hypothetical protein